MPTPPENFEKKYGASGKILLYFSGNTAIFGSDWYFYNSTGQ